MIINNWKDTREQGKVVSSNNIGAVAWCHGVAGLCIPEFYVMSLQRIKNGKIDWNWILKELIRNCRNIGREIVIVCVMVIVEIFGF